MGEESVLTENMQRQFIGLAGFGSFAFTVTATIVLVFQYNGSTGEGIWSVTEALCALTLIIFLFRFLTNLFCSTCFRILLQIASLVLLGIGLIMFKVSIPGESLRFLSLIIFAIAIGIAAITWFTYLSVLGHAWLVFAFSAGVIFAGIVLCLGASQGEDFLLLTTALFGMIALGSFLMLDEGSPIDICKVAESGVLNYDRSATTDNAPTLLMAGGTWGIAAGTLFLIEDPLGVMVVVGVAMSFAALIVLILKRSFEYALEAFSLRFGVLLVSVGLAILPFSLFDHLLLFGCCAYLTAVATIHMMTSLSAIAESARFNEIPPVWLLSEQGLWCCLGALVFAVLIALIAVIPGSLYAPAICFAGIIAFQFLDGLSLNAKYPQYAFDEEPILEHEGVVNAKVEREASKPSWKTILDVVAEENGLTPRQREVMELLAKGRDARYIEETFVVSHATAKSHIANLYRKLGIHSKRELIDYLESIKQS